VINAATWVNETVDDDRVVLVEAEEPGLLLGTGLFHPFTTLIGIVLIGWGRGRREDAIV
jgi:hypothetical protein